MGMDSLAGGAADDIFVFNFLAEGIDTIIDFDGFEGDIIQIDSSGFDVNSNELSRFSFNITTEGVFFDGVQFATLNNQVGFSVDTSIVIV
jgi:Ca2+-binding RTX toxin-like protein